MTIRRFVSIFITLCAACVPLAVFAIGGIPGADTLSSVSAGTAAGSNSLEKINNAGFSLLHTAKIIISALAIIYLVYVGVTMVISASDEGSLAKSKKQFMYSLVAFLFVNIPGQIYNIFAGKDVATNVTTTVAMSSYTNVQRQSGSNIFINFLNWNSTVEGGILAFIKVALVGVAVFMFTLAAIGLIGSAGNEDRIKTAKQKFLYGALALVFMAVIQGWIVVAYSGDIPKGQGIFAQLSNMALFFAGPTAIFFLILWAYYYITSAGDEDKAKKGKSIVVNTFIGVIILLASYAFLKDLASFTL